MAEEGTREELLQQLADQAAQIALLIAQNSELTAQVKLLIEENARQKKRIEQLEQQVKRYVAPHSRETPKADPKPPGRRAGQGPFSFKHAPARDTVTRLIDVEPANICPFCQTPLDGAAYKTDLAWITDTHSVQFPYIRDSTGYTSISRNTSLFLLPLVGLNPQTTRDLIGIYITGPPFSDLRCSAQPRSATASISTRTSRGSFATCTVLRAG